MFYGGDHMGPVVIFGMATFINVGVTVWSVAQLLNESVSKNCRHGQARRWVTFAPTPHVLKFFLGCKNIFLNCLLQFQRHTAYQRKCRFLLFKRSKLIVCMMVINEILRRKKWRWKLFNLCTNPLTPACRGQFQHSVSTLSNMSGTTQSFFLLGSNEK